MQTNHSELSEIAFLDKIINNPEPEAAELFRQLGMHLQIQEKVVAEFKRRLADKSSELLDRYDAEETPRLFHDLQAINGARQLLMSFSKAIDHAAEMLRARAAENHVFTDLPLES